MKKLKEAGITPIIMGAGEKWPMHFYWSYLVMRLGGADVLKKAEAGEDGGFNNPVFIEAGEKLKELADLEPFQEGWLGTLFPASGGMFGDGKGAIDLMGNWLLGTQKENSANGEGPPPRPDRLRQLPDASRRQGQGHRHARRHRRLPDHRGRAARGPRLPEVLHLARAAEGGGRAGLLRSRR